MTVLRLLASGVVAGVLAGCGGGATGTLTSHVETSPQAHGDSLGAVVLLPCGSRVDTRWDPDRIAPGMATSRLLPVVAAGPLPQARRLSQRDVDDMQLGPALLSFYDDWLRHPEHADAQRLARIGLRLQAQTLFVAGVHSWEQKDGRTRVGMLAGLVDVASGEVLWWAEQVHAERAADDTQPAPDFVAVMDIVVRGLVEAFPKSLASAAH